MGTNNYNELLKFKKATEKLEKLKQFYTSKELANKVADEAIKQIRKRTRLGYGVSNGRRTRLKPLSEDYKKTRRKMKGLSRDARPNKSNLTLTGDMLDNMEHKLKKKITSMIITLGADNALNRDKMEWVSEDRPFMGLTKAELRLLNDLIFEEVKKAMKALKLV